MPGIPFGAKFAEQYPARFQCPENGIEECVLVGYPVKDSIGKDGVKDVFIGKPGCICHQKL